jgi:type II secretory pathway pseudopilin PulG
MAVVLFNKVRHSMGFKQKICNQAGFTILEVLISFVLLLIGTVATLDMFGIGMRADANVESSTIALALAQEQMELIKGAGYWSDIDSFASSRVNIGGDYSDFDKEVLVSGDPKNVQVIIYWNVLGGDQRVELSTLFADYNF